MDIFNENELSWIIAVLENYVYQQENNLVEIKESFPNCTELMSSINENINETNAIIIKLIAYKNREVNNG